MGKKRHRSRALFSRSCQTNNKRRLSSGAKMWSKRDMSRGLGVGKYEQAIRGPDFVVVSASRNALRVSERPEKIGLFVYGTH